MFSLETRRRGKDLPAAFHCLKRVIENMEPNSMIEKMKPKVQ